MQNKKAKLNILYTTLRYPPAPGGAEELEKQLAEGMIQLGHNVQVFTSDLKKHWPMVKFNSDEIKNDPKCIKRFYSLALPRLPYPLMPLMEVAVLKEKNLDIIHAHNFYHYPADMSKFYALVKRVPFVFSSYFYIDSRTALKWRIYRRTLGAFTMQADCLIAITDFEKNLILKEYPKIKRIEVINPGIDHSEFENYNVADFLLKYNLPQDKFKILFAGRICTGKGVDLLIQSAPEIIKQFPDLIFLMAGSDFTNELDDLKKMARKLGVEKYFYWLGNLSRSDLISAYFTSDLFVLPSRYEAFGIVLAEAMRAGLPIVATNYSAIPEVVKNKETGLLFELNNFKDLTEKICILINNDALREKMSCAGREESKKYDWGKMVVQVEEIYKSLA